ncbi:MAG: aminopeptidase [Planctomycetota bacterium]|nr:aminopeptidase [Planctomycetota bacterium]
MRVPTLPLLLVLLVTCGCHGAWIASNGSAVVHRLAASRPHTQWISEFDEGSTAHSMLTALPGLLEFARAQGLNVGAAYQRIDSIPGPVSWIVIAADPLTVTLHLWNFPLVGRVPYKGYRFRHHAQAEADHLNSAGWQADVLPVPAWSSLGWFPEPVPRALLELPEYLWATTLFHELVHRTIHLAGQPQLNEGLATFLADRLAQMWLVERHGPESELARRQILYQRDQGRLHRILCQYRDRLLEGDDPERSRQQFLEQLEAETWDLVSAEQLAPQNWSLARVLLAGVYDPAAGEWQRIWQESAHSVPNMIIQIKKELSGTNPEGGS